MPELPEVETIKEQLNQVLPGLVIKEVVVRTKKMVVGDVRDVKGGRIEKVERAGKMLLIKIKYQKSKSKITNQNSKLQKQLNNAKPCIERYRGATKQSNNTALLIHLKLTGRLIFNNPDYEKDKHTHIVITFTNGKKLYFWDLRKFGWIKIVDITKLRNYDITILGPDPLSKEFTVEYLKKILSNWGRPVKLLLMEQSKIAGIGNIYANEALFCAKIAPHHRGRELVRDHPERVEKLYICIQKVLKSGIKYKGASDDSYRMIDGSKGQMQEHFSVYGKVGQPCLNNCGKLIRRMTLGGRGTFFCPRCQR